MKDFLDFLRGSVRPVVTYLFAGTLCAVVVRMTWGVQIVQVVDLSAEVWAGLLSGFMVSLATVIAYWFASRNNRPP